MGRKNSNAGVSPLHRVKVITPEQLKREAEKARYLLREIDEPYATPKAFTHKVSAYLSPESEALLKSVFWKED